MLKIENHCVDCLLPCMGRSCPNLKVEVYYCDECGESLPDDGIYDYEGQELCEYCLKEKCRRG